MAKCTIIGRIRIPVNVYQAVRLNGKKCNEETLWELDAHGGESRVTEFTVENKANIAFDIEFDYSAPTDSEYTIEILDENDNPVVFPFTIQKEIVDWKTKITFDKYIMEDTYEIILTLDFV